METADSSNALDVSARTEDLKYMQALTVNVSNFVSVKLSGRSNYKMWKAQMLCLIESQLLLHIIDAENHFPVDKGVHMIGQYDKLVKGWIFGSVNEKVLNDLIDLGTAQMVWMKLDSLFNLLVSDTEGDSSIALDVSAPDAIAPVVYAMREDLKYLQALNVDVSNFVSEKLEDQSNYYTWKNEILCLIRSHELLHIIHAEEGRFPWDEGDPMTQKYDSLVRGWILNTMNNIQRDEYRMYRSVQLMWRKLESTFTYQPKTSNGNTIVLTDDSSSETQDMEYMQLKSNVYVSKFVSVKLSGHSNYSIWKYQMLLLLQSQDCLDIIDEVCPLHLSIVPRTQNYDSLVRHWILSTMNDEERHKYRIYRSVKLMWSRVKSTFENLKYIEASNVNVSNFVSVKLSNDSNYSIWRAQMLYLLEIHNFQHFITGGYSYEYWSEDNYGKLAKEWILCTMNDELLMEFPAEGTYTAKDLWEKLESRFTEVNYSRPEPVVTASTQDLKYTQAVNVNVSNFVSVKLSGRINYKIWKGQMLCLIESQCLLHIIDKEDGYKMGKYNTLVKGWIFSTMNEQLLSDLACTDNISSYKSAKAVWDKLTSILDRQDPQEVEFGIEFIKDDKKSENGLLESDNTDKKRWYKAVAEGCWRKAKSIFKINKNVATEAVERESSGTEVVRDTPDKKKTERSRIEYVKDTPDVETGNSRTDVKKELYEAAAKGRWRKAKSILRNSETAAIEAITANGNTILHVAVEMGQNYFVEELLGFLKNGKDIEKKNEKGRTALHIAATVGNFQAAQLLVEKRKELLVIEDDDNNSPLHLASEYTTLNIYAYLFKSFAPSYINIRTCQSHRATILAAIFSKQYDLVETLLKALEEILVKHQIKSLLYDYYKEILMAITISYPTDIGFMKSFIYPSFQNVRQKTIVRAISP